MSLTRIGKSTFVKSIHPRYFNIAISCAKRYRNRVNIAHGQFSFDHVAIREKIGHGILDASQEIGPFSELRISGIIRRQIEPGFVLQISPGT